MSVSLAKGTSVSRKVVLDLVQLIKPFDKIERFHQKDIVRWIKSGAEIYRLSKPDVPKKHLVAYFILLDPISKKLLLVDHKKALLWLPTGGHVELNENPRETVKRECKEELNIRADFMFPNPIFLTSTETVGLTAGHIDVSLWYVLKGESSQKYIFDENEFKAIKWFDLDEIPFLASDPHMNRFVRKLNTLVL